MKGKSSKLRTLVAVAVIVLVCLGLAFRLGFGTPSGWGIWDIAALCPLGALEAAIASRTFLPPLMIAFLVTVVLVLIFGRSFCAWGCPVPLLRKVFGVKSSDDGTAKPKMKASPAQAVATDAANADDVAAKAKPARAGMLDVPAKRRGGIADSRNWVLGGALVSTAIFGFPVFCLICPVGLTFATIIVFWRLIQFAEVSWSLIVLPAVLVLEVVVLRRWCHHLCPLGALMSLIARGNRTFEPISDADKCLRTAEGAECDRCAQVCPEGIDLHDGTISAPMNECTRCRACSDACPMSAISFPLIPGRKHSGEDAGIANLDDEKPGEATAE